MNTGANSTTITVTLPCGGDLDDPAPCHWAEMHHYGDGDIHWCPTGFMYCDTHGGTGLIDGPGQCQAWGTAP